MNPLPTAPRCFGKFWGRNYIRKEITIWPNTKWYPLDLCPAKRLKIKVKRVWKRTHLTLHYSIYCSKSTKLPIESKKDYFCLKSCGKKVREIFQKIIMFETSVIDIYFTKLNSRCMRSCFLLQHIDILEQRRYDLKIHIIVEHSYNC